jgi:hypothetical protein
VPLWIKALVTPCYMFVFEWGTITRNYALGALLLFVFCAWYTRRKGGYAVGALILFLAAQATQYAALLSTALVWFVMLGAWLDPEERKRFIARKAEAIACVLFVAAGVLLSMSSGFPHQDSGPANFAAKPDLTHFGHCLSAVWGGFIPFPEKSLISAWGWGMAGPSIFGPLNYRWIYGLFLFPLTVTFFLGSRRMLWTYLGGAALLMLISFVKYESYARHDGHFYLWFLICLWQLYADPRSRPSALPRYQCAVLITILSLQIFDTGFVSLANYEYEFSCARSAVRYIREKGLSNLPIFVYPDYIGIPISGYADAKVYYPSTKSWGSFVIENNKRRNDLSYPEFTNAITAFAEANHEDFLVLMPNAFTVVQNNQRYELERVGNLYRLERFVPCMVGDEIYWIYRFKNPLAPGASEAPPATP